MRVYSYEENPFDVEIKKKTNTRYGVLNYPHQYFYTCGDKSQFLNEIKLLQRRESSEGEAETEKRTINDLFNTFDYIFDKFKKGCFIQFYRKELISYIPFSKLNYINDFGDGLKFFNNNPSQSEYINFKKMLMEMNAGTKFEDCNYFQRNFSLWYSNNGLFRFEFPLNELDSGLPILYDMFESLSRERDIPDCNFFLNKRDFPILRKDKKEAYTNIYGDKSIPIKYQNQIESFLPILSMNSNKDMMDIAIPTWFCWRLFSYHNDKRIFLTNKNKEYEVFPQKNEFFLDFKNKKNIAVFRGSSTGIGYDHSTNIRLFFCHLSSQNIRDEDGLPFLDCKIVNLNCRPRKMEGDKFVRIIDKKKYSYLLGGYMSAIEQSKFKYIVHLPGHSCAYRLTLELFFGSVVLLYPSETNLWYHDMLKPWEHYVPLEKGFNEEEIYEKIRWCKKNEEKCKVIAEKSREFALQYLNREFALDFLQKKLVNLAKTNTIYLYEYDRKEEKEEIRNQLIQTNKNYTKLLSKEVYERYFLEDDNEFFRLYLVNLEDKGKNILKEFLVRTCVQEKLIENRNTTINLHYFQKKYFICKIKSKDNEDVRDELFLSQFINKLCYSRFPNNFTYTFHAFSDQKNNYILSEYKDDGHTLLDSLNNHMLTFVDLVEIWKQICCLLQILQESKAFLHMDCLPWNLIIRKFDFPKEFIFDELGIVIKSKFQPILIDYGNSFVFFKGMAYTKTIPIKLNQLIDIKSLVYKSTELFLKSQHQIRVSNININQKVKELKERLDTYNTIKKIISYFESNEELGLSLAPLNNLKEDLPINITYYSNQVNTTYWELRNYLKINSKYSSLLDNIDKTDNDLQPIDFYFFLKSNEKNCQDSLCLINKVQIYRMPCYNSFVLLRIFRKIIENKKNEIFKDKLQVRYFSKAFSQKINSFNNLLSTLTLQEDQTSRNYKNIFFQRFKHFFIDEFALTYSVFKEKKCESETFTLPTYNFEQDIIPLDVEGLFDDIKKIYKKNTLSSYNFTLKDHKNEDNCNNDLYDLMVNLYDIIKEEKKKMNIFKLKTRSIW